MNAEVFRSWFTQMLQCLEEPCIIVMDNASYHLMLEDNFPKRNAQKVDIQEWLIKKNINFSSFETVVELHERVKFLIPTEKNYELDELAFKMGHEVVRLPPYHCHYNSIEMIWAQVKDAATKEDWVNCVRHAEKIQDDDYQKEIHRQVILEPIILTIQPGDSSSEKDENEDEL